MGLGIGKALKRGMKSVGKKIKDDPLKALLDPFGYTDQSKGAARASVGAVQDVLIPEPAKLPESIVAPIPDDELKRKARERAAQRKYAKAGRAGTMLTSDSNTLG